MVIMLKNQPTGSPDLAGTVRQPLRPRFTGGVAGGAKNALVSEIKGINTANRLYNVFGRIQSDPKIWGFSINDWASRLNTALAVYAPALYFSLVPEKKHFWETNGRNVLIWFTTLGVTVLTKHPTMGVNPMLNHVMPQKRALQPKASETFGDKIGRHVQKGLDVFRPKYDYYDMLHKAGVLTQEEARNARNNKANKWDLDNNQIERLKMKMEQLSEKFKSNKAIEGMSQSEAETFAKNAPKLMNRLSNMKMAALSANAAATIFIIGIWAMNMVFKYIAPHDPDFDASKYNKAKNKSKNSTAASASTNVSAPVPTGTPQGNPQAPVSFSPNLPLGQLPGSFPGAFPGAGFPGQPMGVMRPNAWPRPAYPVMPGGNN
jgi:hypothetical protein